jgi:hypothetical protein
VELIEYVIGYARGLPLALVVIGSDLSSKCLHEWKSALDRYKRVPNKKIHERLRISYVNKILDKCGFFKKYIY